MAMDLARSSSSAARRRADLVFQALALAVLVVALGALAILVATVWRDGIGRFS